MKLNVKAFALTSAIMWGGVMIFWGWTSSLTGIGIKGVELMSDFYVGFAPTFVGGIMGGFWGFIDGLIFGYLLVKLYNYLIK